MESPRELLEGFGSQQLRPRPFHVVESEEERFRRQMQVVIHRVRFFRRRLRVERRLQQVGLLALHSAWSRRLPGIIPGTSSGNIHKTQ